MSVLDDVKQRLDIVEVVSGYVALTQSGRNFKARCPFHTERTPSFTVTPERQTWHCFGACSTGGDVLTFIMKAENLGFPQALRLLARLRCDDLTPAVTKISHLNDCAVGKR
ncbi:MAG: hypothetical protein IIC20_01895 [Chloroflexi bacterium]|nr:hypothetical protein [Chloroflexota bacterium]